MPEPTMQTEPATDVPEGYKTTELGPLPEEWEVVRLDDVAQLRSEGMNPGAAPRMTYVGLTPKMYPASTAPPRTGRRRLRA